METTKKTIESTVERTISAPVEQVFDAWLDPKIPGTPWNMADKLIMNPEVDGFFHLPIQGTAHYGRFTEFQRPARIQHTWLSPNTGGMESTVTVTFEKEGKNTRMTLVHAGLPDTDGGKSHEKGWNYFLDRFPGHFSDSKETGK